MGAMARRTAAPLWRRRANAVLIGFLIVGGFYLALEHRAHLLGVPPYLILLACPLMHLFMHRGHGHGSDGTEPPASASVRRTETGNDR